MPKIGSVLVFLAGIALPAIVSAQPGSTADAASAQPGSTADSKYCAELTRLYRTYVNNPEDPRPALQSPNAASEYAISRCKVGDTATGIGPLEEALKNARIELPRRS
jgi:hypothetical protein